MHSVYVALYTVQYVFLCPLLACIVQYMSNLIPYTPSFYSSIQSAYICAECLYVQYCILYSRFIACIMHLIDVQTNSYIYIHTYSLIRESGTSASAPVVAAMVTLWNDMRLANGIVHIHIHIYITQSILSLLLHYICTHIHIHYISLYFIILTSMYTYLTYTCTCACVYVIQVCQ